MSTSSHPGRTYRSTYWSSDAYKNYMAYLYQLFFGYVPEEYIVTSEESSPEEKPEEEVEEKVLEKLKVTKLDLKIKENTKAHNTSEYDITESVDPKLVVRRGQSFEISANFNRAYDKQTDSIEFIFEIGDRPKLSKGTMVQLDVTHGKVKPRHWNAVISKVEDKEVTFTLQTPPTCIVGKWTLLIDTTAVEEDGDKKVFRYKHKHPIYMLFNPWCSDDSVFMEDEIQRDEYVENDSGKIYSGNYKQIGKKPWDFGQFEDFVLDCCFYLLDLGDLSYVSRGNPIAVIRKISAVVNSEDEKGVLVGNWSGNYSGGTAPTAWVGSVAILKEYWEKKSPVQYGQCWVFSGVCTTVGRALGIPTRSVTNFSSAHDCDGSMSIDVHWSHKGDALDELNDDSVWNFHVWNEAWMARPDISGNFGGWQAFDATPQETSDGVYCAGPCPVYALKRGNVGVPYDAPFIFAEVNADRVHWISQPGEIKNKWKSRLQKNRVGRRISTKKPRLLAGERNTRSRWRLSDPDRHDITEEYKYPEGTEEERASVYRANTWSTRPGIYNMGDEDVKFELKQKDEILVGSSFDVVVRCQNKSREQRTINATVTLRSIYYTGVHKAKVKSHNFDVTLGAIKSQDIVMRVQAEEYLHLVIDQISFKIDVLACVKETKQVHADTDDFRLRRPDLVLEAPKKVKKGEEFSVKIQFQNSMPAPLTLCEWQVEGPGLVQPLRKKKKVPTATLR